MEYRFASSTKGSGVFEVIDEIGQSLVEQWRTEYIPELMAKRAKDGKMKDFVDD